MFVTRRTFERTVAAFRSIVHEQSRDLAGERAARAFAMQRMSELKIEHLRELEEFRRRLAVSQANFEWLTVSFNQATAERQAMFNARTNVSLPPIAIDFIQPPDPTASPTREPVDERPVTRDRVGQPDIADLIDQGLSFEDVGDRSASVLNLAGRVYDDPSSLLS